MICTISVGVSLEGKQYSLSRSSDTAGEALEVAAVLGAVAAALGTGDLGFVCLPGSGQVTQHG